MFYYFNSDSHINIKKRVEDSNLFRSFMHIYFDVTNIDNSFKYKDMNIF